MPPPKENVLLQYCDIREDLLPFIGEVNPDKFGHCTLERIFLFVTKKTFLLCIRMLYWCFPGILGISLGVKKGIAPVLWSFRCPKMEKPNL